MGGEGSKGCLRLRVSVRGHPAQQGTGALAALAQIGGIATAEVDDSEAVAAQPLVITRNGTRRFGVGKQQRIRKR